MPETDGYHVDDFLILPGQWRPQCPWEHIAWISPPWRSQYYLWLDFPEAIFCDQGNLFLSHLNEECPALFPNLPAVAWSAAPSGLSVTRRLPNDVVFQAAIAQCGADAIRLELTIHNESGRPLRELHIQTCAYMRGIMEFSDLTNDNKYVYSARPGWVPIGELDAGGRQSADATSLTAIATVSREADRLVAMTWFEDTARLWANPKHPCMHADPRCPDIPPGERARMTGALLFFEGTIEEATDWFRTVHRPGRPDDDVEPPAPGHAEPSGGRETMADAEKLERIMALDNEVQAQVLEAALNERGIPHIIRSYYDSAYDGLFQAVEGWGHIEAPKECADEIRRIAARVTRAADKASRADSDATPANESGDALS